MLRKGKVNDVLDCKHKNNIPIDLRNISSYFQNVMEKYFFTYQQADWTAKNMQEILSLLRLGLQYENRLGAMKIDPLYSEHVEHTTWFLKIVMDVNGPVILQLNRSCTHV